MRRIGLPVMSKPLTTTDVGIKGPGANSFGSFSASYEEGFLVGSPLFYYY
jgi:hypothetical protein